jgi:tetratricopeptide (TPR) repeat protein
MPSTPSVILASTAVMDRAKPTPHWHPGPQLRSLLFVAAACSFSVASAQSDSLKYKDPRVVNAAALDDAGKHNAAMKAFEVLTADTGLRSIAYHSVATCLFEHQHRMPEAFTAIDNAVAAGPNEGINYDHRALMLQSVGLTKRAMEDLQRSLVLANTDAERKSAHVNIGSVHMQVREWDQAIAEFDAALALDSTDMGAWLNKSVALDELGRNEETLAILMRLHHDEPTNVVVLNNLGFHFSKVNDHATAVSWFERSLEIAPKDAVVMNNLGYAELMTGDTKSALKHIERSIELYPANSYAYRNLGFVWKEKGDREKACAAFKEALSRGYTNQYGPDVKDVSDIYCR